MNLASPCPHHAEIRCAVEESPAEHKNRSEGRQRAESGNEERRKHMPFKEIFAALVIGGGILLVGILIQEAVLSAHDRRRRS